MKKLIYALLLFVLLLPSISIAGEIHGDCSFGYVPEAESFCADLSIRYDFWRISVMGGIETLMEKSTLTVFTFNPYRNVYYFETSITPFAPFYINIKHSCTHVILSKDKQFYDIYEDGNRTTISIGIKW